MTTATENDERRLVESARAGDAQALETLLGGHEPQVFRFAVKMCRHEEDAREVLQDTLLAAARGLTAFRGESAVSTWLYTIARSFCIKKRRRRSVREVSLSSDEGRPALLLPDRGRSPDQELFDRQIRAALERAIRDLSPAYREVLVLRDVEGLSAAKAARITGLSIEAIKSRLHRARAQVRNALAPLLGVSSRSRRARGCPDIVALFSRHLEGEIGVDTCAEMERHLASCPGCRAACDSLKETLRLCRNSPAPRVPGELQESIRTGIRRLLAEKA